MPVYHVKHRTYASPNRVCLGFTLVELLVVIGIISVLIGILLPVLSKARLQANKAVCLSNLRQFHVAIVTYAGDNRDQIPIGYVVTEKQLNSLIWLGKTQRITLFGLLIDGGLMKQPKAFFCPSEESPTQQFDTPDNPWPPGRLPAQNTRAGYGCRPVVNWDEGETPNPMPRLTPLRNLAIFADVVSAPDRLDNRHINGVNVLYGHGGAFWVDRKLFNADLAASSYTFSSGNNNAQQRIWDTLDRQ